MIFIHPDQHPALCVVAN